MSGGNGGSRRGFGGGLSGASPGCCTRKIGGRPGARKLIKPATKTPGSTRTGFGVGRGFGRGGFKR